MLETKNETKRLEELEWSLNHLNIFHFFWLAWQQILWCPSEFHWDVVLSWSWCISRKMSWSSRMTDLPSLSSEYILPRIICSWSWTECLSHQWCSLRLIQLVLWIMPIRQISFRTVHCGAWRILSLLFLQFMPYIKPLSLLLKRIIRSRTWIHLQNTNIFRSRIMSKWNHLSIFFNRSNVRTVLIGWWKFTFLCMVKSLLLMSKCETFLLLDDSIELSWVGAGAWWSHMRATIGSSRNHCNLRSFFSDELFRVICSWAWWNSFWVLSFSSLVFAELCSSLIKTSRFIHIICSRARNICSGFWKFTSSIFWNYAISSSPIPFLIVSSWSRSQKWYSFRSFSSHTIFHLRKWLSIRIIFARSWPINRRLRRKLSPKWKFWPIHLNHKFELLLLENCINQVQDYWMHQMLFDPFIQAI